MYICQQVIVFNYSHQHMGITTNDSRFLFYAKSRGVSYENTLTLGRQILYATKKEIQEHINKFNNAALLLNDVSFQGEFCEPLLKILGAKTIDSIDFSAYEKATIIHDLNKPVPAGLQNKYSVVLDSGTLEHVFDYKTAVKNCMEMVRPGGHFLGISPVNNLMGHGFYQFTPELFYSVFSPVNGFEIEKMVIGASDDAGNMNQWYEVINPGILKSRLHMVNAFPTYIMFIARKIKNVPVFETTPQQSDYISAWNVHEAVSGNATTNESAARIKYHKYVPRFIRDLIYKVRKALNKKNISTPDLGNINPEHFRKMDV